MTTVYIVWNEARTEGFVTRDRVDALWVQTGKRQPGQFGVPTVGEALLEAHADQGQRLVLEVINRGVTT